eukprot:4254136-Prymnesium_polylepis.1
MARTTAHPPCAPHVCVCVWQASGPWDIPMDLELSRLAGEGGKQPKRVMRLRWKLDFSIWATRKKASASRDYFETEESMRRM